MAPIRALRRHASPTRCCGETLEARILLAVLAPDSLAGFVLDVRETGGGGGYRLTMSPTANTYALKSSSDVPDSSGTFTYVRTGGSTARLTYNDARLGSGYANMTFSTATAGRWVLYAADEPSPQSATFAFANTPFARLQEGILTVNGTSGADGIAVSTAGGRLITARNSSSLAYILSAIRRICIYCGDGNDKVSVGAGAGAVYAAGEGGNDRLVGGTANDSLTGGAGKDTLSGGAGDDYIKGSGGHDYLIGGSGYDRLYGEAGNDLLYGGGNVDRLYGGADKDRLYGGYSNDKLYGESGDDTLCGEEGVDLVNGGVGTDTAEREPLANPLSIEQWM